jgi:ParB family chromosome partitioning protein
MKNSSKLAAERVIKEGLNVRQTEGLVAKLQNAGPEKPSSRMKTSTSAGDPHVADLEAKLREVFATKVKLNYAQGKGSLEISFFSERGTGTNFANSWVKGGLII